MLSTVALNITVTTVYIFMYIKSYIALIKSKMMIPNDDRIESKMMTPGMRDKASKTQLTVTLQ